MGLLWDDPSWHWDDVIVWDQVATGGGSTGGTVTFPFPDPTGLRVPRRRRARSLHFN